MAVIQAGSACSPGLRHAMLICVRHCGMLLPSRLFNLARQLNGAKTSSRLHELVGCAPLFRKRRW